jgi:hypothetical protein
LCERAEACGFGDGVVLYDRIRVLKHRADSLRHLGRNRESLKAENEIKSWLDRGTDVFSLDEELGFAVSRAAATIDMCDFRGALRELEDWLKQCETDPRRFTGQKRVELLNTAGRAMILSEIDGWNVLFERAIGIQCAIDRASIRRTEGFQIEGFLRFNRLDRADSLLRRHEQALSGDSFSDGFTRFYRCDLERRRGNLWPALCDEVPAWHGYIGAFALQAMARQRGRDVNYTIRLLERAEGALRDQCQDDQNILRLIAGAVALVRAAVSGDGRLWNTAGDWFAQHVRELGEAQWSYFEPAIQRLGHEPDIKAAEKLLSLLPYV